MMNKQKLNLVPDISTIEKAEVENIQQTSNQEIEETSEQIEAEFLQPEFEQTVTEETRESKIIPKESLREMNLIKKENGREWKGLIYHSVTASTIGGVATVFHNVFHAPPEVLMLILVLDVIYILEVVKRLR